MNTTGKNTKRTLPWRDNIGYAMGNLGSNLVFGMATFYMLYFYTDVMVIPAASVAILFLVARLWDAVNDPIMGIIVDKTHTRWGKFRPYVFIGIWIVAILYVLTFTTPHLSTTGKIIYAYFTYIPLGMAVTMVNIPYHAQTTILTEDPMERAEVGVTTNITCLVGTIIVASFTLPMVKSLGSTPQHGFTYTTMIFGAAMIICYLIAVMVTKKYDTPRSKDNLEKTAANYFTLKEKTRVLTKNRPLMALMGGYFFFQMAAVTITSIGIYFFKYYLHREGLYPIFMGLFILVNVLGMLIVPYASRKLGKKKVFLISNWISTVSFIAVFVILYFSSNPQEMFLNPAILGLFLLANFFSGPVMALVWGIIPDTVEYAEWKVGIRSEGLIFSLLSFMMKASIAIGGAMCGLILSWLRYVPGKEQSPATLFGIMCMMTLIPGLIRLFGSVSMHFYNLDEATFDQIVTELKSQRVTNTDLSSSPI